MTKSIKIDENLENYISNNSSELHPVQKELIEYNNSLGDIKRMQISVTQGYFMQFIIKNNKRIYFKVFIIKICGVALVFEEIKFTGLLREQ